jgi:hypothetical protein
MYSGQYIFWGTKTTVSTGNVLPSITSQKVLPFAILSHQSVIKAHTQDAQEPKPPLLDTLMMQLKPESDFLQVQEKLFLVAADPQLVLLSEVVGMRSQS